MLFISLNIIGKYRRINMKQKKLIQVKYPPFDTTVKTYADIYKYEDEMTEKDHKDLRAEIFKNQQWTGE